MHFRNPTCSFEPKQSENMKAHMDDCVDNCEIKLRENPQRHKDKIYIGCGAGFGGDRPLGALKLLERVKTLDYLVIECLAERTLADRYQIMMSGGDGYDSRISDWMHLLLPLAVERGICIITNMGAMDSLGAQEKVLNVASNLGLSVTVAVAYECNQLEPGSAVSSTRSGDMLGGVSTYLGAAPIVHCLEKYKPDVIITSRVADASLFLGPMVYELGWNWNDFDQLARGSLAAHLLECGCQLTGGYFMHPGDKYRDFSFQELLDMSLPYVEVGYEGDVCVAKAENSGGEISCSTCAEQLLYEVGDPSAYITPDVVVDFQNVTFRQLSKDKVLCAGARVSSVKAPEKLLQLVPRDSGWKGWGEISYGGHGCVKRAAAAEFLVRSWTEEGLSGVQDRIISYAIGVDSLKASSIHDRNLSMENYMDIRLRMDGLFELKEHALHFIKEFLALYTNGPAGGGGISTGHKKEVILQREQVPRESVFWRTNAKQYEISLLPAKGQMYLEKAHLGTHSLVLPMTLNYRSNAFMELFPKKDGPLELPHPAPSNQEISLYDIAHSRAGDKGNDLNFSLIPHFPQDIERLKVVITPKWVKSAVSPLFNTSLFLSAETKQERNSWVDEHLSVEIYEVKGIQALNVVVRNVLDGGVNCSRRIDRHGKTFSDVILCHHIVLPP
ncbi:uncharacterized protein LOC18422907 [Amborella trichopoda]|nr:uncharacterized protein LOC18422907 [Amborella trichopoda]|eukprot:XP_006827704.3 uncharacterized protein LOC18422907 [Amborella trichopoda]